MHWVTVKDTVGCSEWGKNSGGRVARGEQGLTWAQRGLLGGHLVTVQLTLTLKQTQPDSHRTTRCRPVAPAAQRP